MTSSIKLPVAALLKQYKDNSNTLVRHFDLLYVQQGVDKLPRPDQLALLPTLLLGLAGNYRDSKAHAASLFHVLLKLLHSLTLPPRGSEDDVHLRVNFGFNQSSEDAAFVALWLGKLLLFNVPRLPGMCHLAICPYLHIRGSRFSIDRAARGYLWHSNIQALTDFC